MRDWLKNLREDRKMTQKDVASKLGISESYYCSIERGERQKKMDMFVITGLALAFDVPVTEIAEKEAGYLVP